MFLQLEASNRVPSNRISSLLLVRFSLPDNLANLLNNNSRQLPTSNRESGRLQDNNNSPSNRESDRLQASSNNNRSLLKPRSLQILLPNNRNSNHSNNRDQLRKPNNRRQLLLKKILN